MDILIVEFRIQMPEGPEVRILAEYLEQRLIGYRIHSVAEVANLKVKGIIPDLTHPYIITAVKAYGKSILFIFQGSSPLIMESKLAMEGKWLHTPGSYTKFILGLSKTTSLCTVNRLLYFDDMRSFGSLRFHSDGSNITERVGFDLLEYAIQNSNRLEQASQELLPYYKGQMLKAKDHDITYFLMNQKYLSGVGNYLKAEILYASKVHPGSKTSSLVDNHALELLYNSLCLILQAYRSGGLTIRTYVSPSGVRGTFDTKVYGKTHDPTGYSIYKQTFQDKRTTHYCPEIQKILVV
jgi:formamidopyrimidine-DNA glycosylase